MLESIRAWWDEPFDSEGDVWTWFLFIGMLIVIIFAWSRVLRLISDTTAAVIEAA